MVAQPDGTGSLAGTCPSNLKRSVKAHRMNKFLHPLVEPQCSLQVSVAGKDAQSFDWNQEAPQGR